MGDFSSCNLATEIRDFNFLDTNTVNPTPKQPPFSCEVWRAQLKKPKCRWDHDARKKAWYFRLTIHEEKSVLCQRLFTCQLLAHWNRFGVVLFCCWIFAGHGWRSSPSMLFWTTKEDSSCNDSLIEFIVPGHMLIVMESVPFQNLLQPSYKWL